MKLSMGTIKNKVLPLPDGTEVVLPEECHPIMNEARDLYVRGFKQNDNDAMEEFLDLLWTSKFLGEQLLTRNLDLLMSTLCSHLIG